MSIADIESQLRAAQEQMEAATKALAPKHQGGEWEEYWAAHEAVLRLERELAAAKGEQYAVPLDFPVKWGSGAPLPHLTCNGLKTFLTFQISEPVPDRDGTNCPDDKAVPSLALVEFIRCVSAKLGTPNDEVLEGHPLNGKGLDAYTAQKVENSRWLVELESINQVHRCYDPAFWRGMNHYIFWFHDTSFECIAQSFKVEVFRESMADLLARVCKRLLV